MRSPSVAGVCALWCRLRLGAISGLFELNLPQPHLKFYLFSCPPVFDVCGVPSDIYPGAVDDVWPLFRIFGVWFTHVPVLAFFEVEIFASRFAETLDDAISFDAVDEPCMVFWAAQCLSGVFVGIRAGVGPCEFPFRPHLVLSSL